MDLSMPDNLAAQLTAEATAASAPAPGAAPVMTPATTQPAAPPPAAAPPAPAPAAPAAPAAAAPTAEEEVPGARTDENGQKWVPVSALVQTRQELKGQLRDTKAMLDNTQRTLEAAMKAGGQPAAAAAAAAAPTDEKNPHDKNLNPLEHTQWELEKANRRLAAIEDTQTKTQQTSVAQQNLQKAQSTYIEAHNDFVTKNPTYKPAYDFVTEKLVSVHEALGHPRKTAIEMAAQMEWNTVVDAVTRNLNPMQVLWNMALKLGFNPTAAGAVAAGSAAPAPATPPAGQSPADRIKFASEAAQAALTLSGIPGGQPAGAVASLQALATMDKDTFAAAFAGPDGDAKWTKAMMGA